MISLIVAMASNRVIGLDGGMPWHIPDDLKHFKAMTMGKPLVMGRKTWESLGGPLPGRAHIVVSRNPDFTADGATVVSSVSEALALAETMAEATGANEIMVIGGAQIYERAISHADRIYLTEIQHAYEGDTVFPEINHTVWREVSRQQRVGDPPFAFTVLERERGEASLQN